MLPQIVEAESAQPGAVKTGQELIVGQVALIENRAHLRRKISPAARSIEAKHNPNQPEHLLRPRQH